VEGYERMPLGVLLIEHGVLDEPDVERALADQARSGRRLGEILVESDLVSRPFLARVLAQQGGVALEADTGFGSGLRSLIERRHLERAGLLGQLAAVPSIPTERRAGERRAAEDRRRTLGRRQGDASW
jgi:hypothetical protein